MNGAVKLMYNKENLICVYLLKILKGDCFIYNGNSHKELNNKTIEVLEILEENVRYKVAVDGVEYRLPFNISMFDNMILIR